MNTPADTAATFETLSYRRGENGVARIAIDVKDRSLNVLTPELHRELGMAARVLADDDRARGAVVYSAKSSFMAGGDLNRIVRYYDQGRTAEQAYAQSRTYSRSLRTLETCGKPVAVAINGTALGGGLELALACHHRVVADDPALRLGFPEVGLGLIPGGGGTQRLPRIVGIEKAASLILSGERLGPEEAMKLGLVDRVVPADDLLEAAQAWVLSDPDPHQPWDRKAYRVPHGSGLNDMKVGSLFQRLTAAVGAEYRHNYPAPVAVLRCLFNGTTVGSMDQALEIETREFSALTRDPVARNLIRTLFIHKARTRIGELLAQEKVRQLEQACQGAYLEQGRMMARSGVSPVLIENVAFSAGFRAGPLALAGEAVNGEGVHAEHAGIGDLRDRLMCCQALAACECWERGATDPVEADLASVFGWGFPSYSGGVMSYVDTLGLNRFIQRCDELSAKFDARLEPSRWLREQAAASDRIYAPVE